VRQAGLVARNLTYNERVNGGRYAHFRAPRGGGVSNPYDRGSLGANLKAFLESTGPGWSPRPPASARTAAGDDCGEGKGLSWLRRGGGRRRQRAAETVPDEGAVEAAPLLAGAGAGAGASADAGGGVLWVMRHGEREDEVLSGAAAEQYAQGPRPYDPALTARGRAQARPPPPAPRPPPAAPCQTAARGRRHAAAARGRRVPRASGSRREGSICRRSSPPRSCDASRRPRRRAPPRLLLPCGVPFRSPLRPHAPTLSRPPRCAARR